MSGARSLYSIMNEPFINKLSDNESMIYFLIRDEEIVYVGQTRNLSQRLSHHSNKVFDRYNYIIVSSDYADITESVYIHAINPEYNSDMTHHAAKFKTREKRAPHGIDSIINMLCEFMDKNEKQEKEGIKNE
ncbi:GIY-YIG nuclease superfamily protein [Vibrio phage 1.168.O._10N.261.52.A10]|nr:GIY-YIG nuclease superfamily protein [Vibrio phage 1.168.O._10N.261.52.A10]